MQLSCAVNRAWGSSMEIGVRVMRESQHDPPGIQSYCCHAYLTFVAKPVQNTPPTSLARVSHALGLKTRPSPTRKFQLPEVVPTSTLETKRFLLAGRRRAHRLKRSKESDALLSAMRDEVLRLEKEMNEAERGLVGSKSTEDTILALQTEMVVEAWMRRDSDLRVEGDSVVAEIEGFMAPVKVKKDVVEKAAREKGLGGYRRLSVPDVENVKRSPQLSQHAKRLADLETPLELKDTLVLGLWIVRPQHGEDSVALRQSICAR